MEKVCTRLGVGMIPRKVAGDRPVMEIAGIDIAAIEKASSRREGIKPALDKLVADFTDTKGYAPNTKQMIALAQQATLETRPGKKSARQLSALVAEWTEELGQLPGVQVGPAAVEKARSHRHDARDQAAKTNPDWMVTHADELDPEAEAAGVIGTLERTRGVWGEHHIDAETRRRLGSRFGELPIPPALIEQVKARAIDQFSLRITPDTPAPEIEALKLRNGASRYGKVHAALYTSSGILHSEDRLLTAASRTVIPAATPDAFDTALAAQDKQFDAGQLQLAREFACSDRLLLVGVGPAGAGKTTALKLAADTVRAAGGQVIGLAPTAAAAAVMGTELGAKATTIDSFVLSHQTDSPRKVIPAPGDVIIIDEAGMVGTGLFAAAVTIADQYGAVVRALGDDQQLSAVGSGGALRLLKNTVGAVHLEDLHRFRNPDGSANEDEAAATLALREPPATGEDDPWTFYRDNRRVVGGDADTMTSLVYAAWEKDTAKGKHSVMMAYDNATVTELNARAQAYRLGTGTLDDGPAATLRDGLTARAGDVIVTRENNRRLTMHRGKDFVKNNDVWDVRQVHPDGSLTARNKSHGGTITLPAAYVRDNTMLGYAATIHRTQGITCDTTHALIGSGLSRSLAYVAASRGRESNHLYGVTQDGETLTDVLRTVAANHDGNLTAHEQIDAARAHARSLPDMAAAYKDIDAQANELRMATTARRILGDATAQPFIASDAWGATATHLRHAENDGYNLTTLLKDTTAYPFEKTDDIGSVLSWRVQHTLQTWRERTSASGSRPLEAVSDDALARLERRAAIELIRARANAGQTPDTGKADQKDLIKGWRAETSTTPWQRRLHGHLTDDDLDARITRAKERARTDTTINDPDAARKNQWLTGSLQKEKALRERLPAEARADETYERGPVTNHRRNDTAHRVHAARYLHQRIDAEIQLRRQLPAPVDEVVVPDGVPAWMAPADVITHHDTPALWRKELQDRREAIALEMNRIGSQLAAEPPAWAAAFGPVPSDTAQQQRWRQLAAEVKTYRDTYRIPDTDTTVLPATHTATGTGSHLAARVTAMHKYTAQTKKAPLAPEDAALMAEAAEVEALVAVEPTPAEQVVDRLREDRAQEAGETHQQGRADRIAELARKVRNNRPGAQTGDAAPESVDEALDDIRKRREAEQTTGAAAGGEGRESFHDRLAKLRHGQHAGAPATSDAVARLRAAQAEQAAEQARQDTGGPERGTGPEQGRRGPRL